MILTLILQRPIISEKTTDRVPFGKMKMELVQSGKETQLTIKINSASVWRLSSFCLTGLQKVPWTKGIGKQSESNTAEQSECEFGLESVDS